MPAAAVIPAPIAYIKVVAVEKLVVEGGRCLWRVLGWLRLSLFLPRRDISGERRCIELCRARPGNYCEEIRVFHAGILPG